MKLIPRYMQFSSMIFSLLFIIEANAQEVELPAVSNNIISRSRDDQISKVTIATSPEFWLALSVLAFGVFIITIQYLLFRNRKNVAADEIFRIFTVTMIVVGTLALIALGYSETQIAPALGLFGSILGYLLGKSSGRQDADRGGPTSDAAGVRGKESE